MARKRPSPDELQAPLLDDYPFPVAGVDEAGRGPLAGPVVAAAVLLNPGRPPEGIRDSKLLRPEKRVALFDLITEAAQVGVGHASVDEIDRLNILQATFLAMRRAMDSLVATLNEPPALMLIDGNGCPPDLPWQARAVIGGDRLSLSIAAASIIAKVTRDRMMGELAKTHPDYGWERNQGYGTAEHLAAVRSFGVTAHHRKSFRPISEILVRNQPPF